VAQLEERQQMLYEAENCLGRPAGRRHGTRDQQSARLRAQQPEHLHHYLQKLNELKGRSPMP
jgi:hypothetical protein